MSGLGNFSLNTLGNMSTLGSLAQSAQRLDRLMAGNRSRQEDNYGRNNSRRSMDDDFFGGRSSDRGRRRSPSPPRRFNRDDRRNDDRRDRRRNREDSIYGSSSGAGILGAAPSGNDRSSMNSGLGDLGGSSWNDNNPRGGLNLDTQTQQLLNMMQTQQLLAAVQAQAKLANQANQQPPSLMGTNTGYSRQGGRMMNQRGGRFGRNDPPRQGYNRRDDRKRRRSPPARPFKRDRKDDNTARKDNRKTSTGDKDEAKKDAKQEGKETKAKSLAKGAEGKDKKQESVESETKITKNAAGEDVEELVKNNYDGKRYWCSLCKIVCMKSKNIYKHFVTERHVKAAIEKQGKVFDPEIMKQQEAKKEEPKKESTKDISEFLKYVCTTKQTAKKVNNDIYISSLTDCTVKITDFTTEQDFMGSEFVKAVSGFKCQLCKSFLRHGHQIIEHLRGKRHTANYEKYLKENPEYLKSQRDVNKNLVDMLKKDEGKDVVLQENNGEGLRADDGDHKSDRKDEESDFMDEYDLNENSTLDDDSKMADESSFNDSAINDSIQDYSLVESEKEAEKNEEELESEDKTETKEIEEANEVEKVEVENKEAEKKEVEVEKEVSEGGPEEKEKELPMEADELEEEFPLLEPPANQMKEDEPVEPKVEEKPEVEAKVPEVDTKAKEPETPETPIEPVVEPEETEDVTPSRRGRKGKRGRGSAKAATRGRRRTPRAAKNVKKTEEVIEPGEIVDAPVEAEKDPEKEAEPEVPAAEVPKADVEEPASSQETEEMALSQETAGDVEGIDGFEVIDEVEGESEGESEDEA